MASKVQPERRSIFHRTGFTRHIQRHLFVTIVLICATAGLTSRVYAGPAPVSVTPSSGSGASQTFKFTYSHPNGFAAITSVSLIINSVLSDTHACYLYYNRASNSLYLAGDYSGKHGWIGPMILGKDGIGQNSQ